MENDRRTIVGGRSRGNRLLRDFPRGFEILLKKAKVDDEFREHLLLDPLTAAERVDLTLSQQEKLILQNTPRTLLQTMINSTTVPKQHVNAFRTTKKAAVLLLLLGTTAVIAGAGSKGEEADYSYSAVPEERPEASNEQMEEIRDILLPHVGTCVIRNQ